MIRTFSVDLAPSRARLLERISIEAGIEVSSEIQECAKQDCIADEQFTQLGISDTRDKELIQFIHDSDFRVGIPSTVITRKHIEHVVAQALKLTDREVVQTGFPHQEPMSENLSDIIPHRKKILLVNLDNPTTHNYDLLGRLFSRIIITGLVSTQYNLRLGIGNSPANSTHEKMGEILYPSVFRSISKTSGWRKNSPKSMLSMGVFPLYSDTRDPFGRIISEI